MDKAIILFDIDNTLFNSQSLMRQFYTDVGQKLGKSIDEINEAKNEFKIKNELSTGYKQTDLLKFFAEKYGISFDELEKIYFNVKFDERYFFPDTMKVLEKLYGKYILGVFSEGDYDYQIYKLEQSKILKYLDQEYIVIADKKLDEKVIEKLPEGATIIDDNEIIIKKLNQIEKFNLIWLNRTDDRKSEIVPTIHNLNELLSKNLELNKTVKIQLSK